MDATLLLVVVTIIIALAFDVINGFHDAANSIATVVSTRVLTPLQAVVWAAFFNFVAAFGFGVSVATTVGKGVVEPAVVDQWVILAGLVGAIVWDLRNASKIQECIVRISDLENEADRLYNEVIAALFRKNGRDPIEILKWKEIYEGLENACDQCKNYTHVIGNIVVKNS